MTDIAASAARRITFVILTKVRISVFGVILMKIRILIAAVILMHIRIYVLVFKTKERDTAASAV
ncbi:hypothetical protein [Oceanisphaera avium]|uniref:Uncharacterized protein n=1 Tax=Oceanisphaera avium TaxID=1903694 RepID=A0A1Y0CV71_9GAMM|nr:hypothetical protein [Oceanisphaera avium]ART78797.1 hypothetical protein CBP12_00380 [Oceanisphaera avium]